MRWAQTPLLRKTFPDAESCFYPQGTTWESGNVQGLNPDVLALLCSRWTPVKGEAEFGQKVFLRPKNKKNREQRVRLITAPLPAEEASAQLVPHAAQNTRPRSAGQGRPHCLADTIASEKNLAPSGVFHVGQWPHPC